MLISNDVNTKRYFGFDRPADSVFTKWTRPNADTIIMVVYDHADTLTLRFNEIQIRELKTFLGEYEHFVYETDERELLLSCPHIYDRLHLAHRSLRYVSSIVVLTSGGQYTNGQLIWGDERGVLLDTSDVPFDARSISKRTLQWLPIATIRYFGRGSDRPDWIDMMHINGRTDALTAAITVYMKSYPVYTSSVPPELYSVLQGGVAPLIYDPSFPDYELLTLLPPTTAWVLLGFGYAPFAEAPQVEVPQYAGVISMFASSNSVAYVSALAGIDTRLNSDVDVGAEVAFHRALDDGDMKASRWIKQYASAASVGGSVCYILGRLDVGSYQPETGRFRVGAGLTFIHTTVKGSYSKDPNLTTSFVTTLNSLNPYLSASFSDYTRLTNHTYISFRLQAEHHFSSGPHNVTWPYYDGPFKVTFEEAMPWMALFAVGVTF